MTADLFLFFFYFVVFLFSLMKSLCSSNRNRLKDDQSYRKQFRFEQRSSIRQHCPRLEINDESISSSDPSDKRFEQSNSLLALKPIISLRSQFNECAETIATGHGTSDDFHRRRSTLWNVPINVTEQNDISLSKTINRSRFFSY